MRNDLQCVLLYCSTLVLTVILQMIFSVATSYTTYIPVARNSVETLLWHGYVSVNNDHRMIRDPTHHREMIMTSHHPGKRRQQ